MTSASTDYQSIRKAELTGRAAARAAALPAFVAHAAAIGADFDVEVQTAAELRAVLVAIGGHNHFDPERAAELLGPLVREAMRVLIRSCTDGPYLYFTLPHFDGQCLEHLGGTSTGEKLTAEHRIVIAEQFVAAGIELKADAVRVTQGLSITDDRPAVHRRAGDNPHTIMLWWD